MTLPPHKIGDRGQRFEVRYSDFDHGAERIVGWSDDRAGAEQMASAWRQHPGVDRVRIVDREKEKKHEARALRAIAAEFCSTDLTDGFCMPSDGQCVGQKGERPPHRNCVVKARGCIRAMAGVGVKPVWVFDKEDPK